MRQYSERVEVTLNWRCAKGYHSSAFHLYCVITFIASDPCILVHILCVFTRLEMCMPIIYIVVKTNNSLIYQLDTVLVLLVVFLYKCTLVHTP